MAAIRALLVLLLSVGPALACFPHPNLMICLELEKGNGLVAEDSSGSRFAMNGTLTGTVGWVPSTMPRAVTYANASGTNTFANTGTTAVTFSGDAGANVRTPTTGNFSFSGKGPYIAVITAEFPTLRDGTDREIMGWGSANNGWYLYKNNADLITYINLGVGGTNFGIMKDTNPHRYMLARNNARDTYLFIDGVIDSISELAAPDMLYASDQPLFIGGGASGVSPFNGKANHFALYNFNFTLDEIKAFARNEYLYWQGLKQPKNEEVNNGD